MFDNVNFDWNLSHDDGSTDFSDDETIIDDRVSKILTILAVVLMLTVLEWFVNAGEKEPFTSLQLHRGRFPGNFKV